MCRKLSSILKGFFLACLAHQCYGKASTSYSCQQQAKPGLPFNITCHITGTLSSGISWLRPRSVPVVDCTGPAASSCVVGVVGYDVVFGDTTVNILNIASMSTSDEGAWTCRDGGSGPSGCEIVSSVHPDKTASSVALDPGNSLDVNDYLNITVILTQYYCSQSVSFHISLNGNQVPLTGIPSSDSVFHNASTEVTVQVTENMAGPMKLVMGCGGQLFDVTVQGLTSVDIATPTSTSATPTSTSGCLCQCSCACKQTSKIVLIVIIILLVITVAVVIAFIIIFCVYNIKKYDEQYRLAVLIGAIVVCIGAIACTIVVTVEKPQVDDEDCCCSTCDPDGEEMEKECVGLKIAAACFSILVAVLTLIIIIVILIVWCCPGKCGTARLLMFCNYPPAEAGPSVGNNYNGGRRPSNTVTPAKAQPTSHVEMSPGTSSHSGRHQSGNETTGKGTEVRMLPTNTTNDSPSGTLTPIDFSKLSPGRLPPLNTSPDYAIDEEDTSKEHEENGTGPLTDKKKSKKRRKKKIRSQRGGETE